MSKPILLLLLCCFAVTLSAQNYTVENPTGKAGDKPAVEKADLNEKIYRTTDVDSKPQLKDGMLALSTFIGYHFKFPDLKNKKVKIFASFVVEPDGSMSDVRTFHISVKDLVENTNVKIATEEEKAYEAKQTDALKAETVRVLSAFNEKWIPAVENGKPVRCLYNYPINFNIE
ncbi:hypothetical protein [Flavobacterium sp.]|uniref:hypothetical protein n=1 Tax=Flavobacterium sp. TaxID=239 RepID=UPI0039E59D3B